MVAYLNELVWKYHVFPLDRLLLCMVSIALPASPVLCYCPLLPPLCYCPVLCYCCLPRQVMRGYDGQFAHTCLSIVHYMLLTNQDFQSRVSTLVKEVGH